MTATSNMEVSGKSVSVWMGISFLLGVMVGYKLKAWRVQYLQTKRDFLRKKTIEAQKQVDLATGRL